MPQLTKEGLDEIVSNLQEKEIESGLSDEENAYLLLGYLCTDDRLSAKHLWKRIPIDKKQEQFLGSVQFVYKHLWKDKYDEFFKTVKQQWPEDIQPYIDYLTKRVRRNNLIILSNYSSLPLEQFCNLVGLEAEEGVAYVNQLGWKFEGNLVYPSFLIEQEDYVNKDFSPLCRIATSMEKNSTNDGVWKKKESSSSSSFSSRNAAYNTPPTTEDPDGAYSFYEPDDSFSPPTTTTNRFKPFN